MLCQFILHVLPEVLYVSAGLFIIPHGDFQGFRKSYNPVYILGTGAHIALLPTAKDEGPHLDVLIYIEDAGTLRPMEFMAGRRNEIHVHLRKIDGIVSNRLHAIGMK